MKMLHKKEKIETRYEWYEDPCDIVTWLLEKKEEYIRWKKEKKKNSLI